LTPFTLRHSSGTNNSWTGTVNLSNAGAVDMTGRRTVNRAHGTPHGQTCANTSDQPQQLRSAARQPVVKNYGQYPAAIAVDREAPQSWRWECWVDTVR
jgi:hypothetical protein